MIKLDEIIDALEFNNDSYERVAYFNKSENKVMYINDFQEIEEDYDNLILIPDKYEIFEYSMLEEFVISIDDSKIKDDLLYSIKGRKAFRRFKDKCIYYNIIDKWYMFRDKKYREIAINWCNENKIEFEE